MNLYTEQVYMHIPLLYTVMCCLAMGLPFRNTLLPDFLVVGSPQSVHTH
jgi:hypothetical protein